MNLKKSKGSHESRSSRASRETRSCKSSRDREIEEKMKVAQQKQMIQNEAEKLKIKKRLAKTKARI